MQLSTVLSFARAQVQTDINGLTDANGIIYANEALLDFHRRLVQHGVDASQLQESSITGVAGQGVYMYPAIPASVMALKAIEVNYTNTDSDNYITAQQIDVSNLPQGQSFSYLRNNQLTINPLFDDRGDRIEIFPTPTSANNLTGLINMFYFTQPSVYSSSIATVNYPESLDTTILGWRIAANYLYSLGSSRIPDGDKFMQRYEDRVTQYIETLGRGSQQPLKAQALQLDGWNY